MSIFNQLTMVQLTIDNAKMQIQSPKSTIPILQAWPRVPFGPFVPCVPDVRGVSDVSNVSAVRDVSNVSVVRGVSANARCPKKKQNTAKSESGILRRRDSKLDPVSRVSSVSGVSGVSGVSFLSCVSTVSATHGLCKK